MIKTVNEKQASILVQEVKAFIASKGHFDVQFKHKNGELDVVLMSISLKVNNNGLTKKEESDNN